MKAPISRLTMFLVPLAVFAAVLFLLWRGLELQPEIPPSPLIGKPLPHFHLSNMLAPSYPLTEEKIKGKVSLVNVFASWCSACEMEHPMMMAIMNQYQIPIYGIAYKDTPKNIKAFLAVNGNPYTAIGNDNRGEVAMELGVYGTPETFIVDKKGVIVHRHVGIISEQVWEDELLPIIKELKD